MSCLGPFVYFIAATISTSVELTATYASLLIDLGFLEDNISFYGNDDTIFLTGLYINNYKTQNSLYAVKIMYVIVLQRVELEIICSL